MKRQEIKSVAAKVPLRPGEGTTLKLKLDRLGAGGDIAVMGLDLAAIPVPDRKYVADVCGVSYGGSVVKLFFGQCPVNDDLQNLVVINMSLAGVGNILAAIDQIESPTYAEIAEKDGFAELPLSVPKLAPTQTVTLAANFALTAMAGHEASIDFLRASPFSLAAAKSGQIAVDSIVRVDLSSGLFLGLVSELRRITTKPA